MKEKKLPPFVRWNRISAILSVFCFGLIGRGDAIGYDQQVLRIETKGRVTLLESAFADEYGNLIIAQIEIEELPNEFDLYQNYPNPFNPATTIRYDLPQNTDVRLDIYNILGQRVYTLVNAPQKAGRYEVRFDASSLASGVYFYRLMTGEFASVKQMTLIKQQIFAIWDKFFFFWYKRGLDSYRG